MDARAGRSGPGGFTLVEILVASLVMVLCVVPLIGLLTSEKTGQQSEEGLSEAVAFCQDMMEKVISDSLPFELIDCGKRGDLLKGGVRADVAQAGFVSKTVREKAWDENELEKIVSDGVTNEPSSGQPSRFKKVKGKTYFVFFFAGKYPDKGRVADAREPGSTRPDIDETLTFCYLGKPAGYGEPYNFTEADQARFNRQVVLDGKSVSVTAGGQALEANPYKMGSYVVAGSSTRKIETIDPARPFFYHDDSRTFPDKPGARLIPGWPDPRVRAGVLTDFDYNPNKTSGTREQWMRHVQEVVTAGPGSSVEPCIGYHPFLVSQRDFQATGGYLMKIVLGVKFYPYEHSRSRRNTGDNMREFWLVSFKANLEE